MRRIVIIGDLNWSINRVDTGIEKALKDDYIFSFYDYRAFYLDQFLADVHKSDIVMIALYLWRDVLDLLKTDEERRKVVLMCHGYMELTFQSQPSNLFTYGVTSPFLLPKMNKIIDNPIYVTPNGVDHHNFYHQNIDGKINSIGWCGALVPESKRHDWAIQIARKTELPLSIATSLLYKDMKDWYHTIDLLIVTSGPGIEVETGPLPPFEAIVSGIPVIGTVVGNFSFVPGPKFSTIEEAVSIINRLKQNPEEVKKLAQEQYEYVMNNWTYEALKYHWIKMFDHVISSNVSNVKTTDTSNVEI
jgi:glycosyltransferase involved in cell wall biosynthesis